MIIINEKRSFPYTFIFENNTIIVLWKTLSCGGCGIRRIISPFAPVELAIIVKRYYCITHRRETSFASLSEHFSFTPKFVHKVRKQYRIVRACLCAAFCLLRVFAETVSERIFEIGFSQSGFYTFYRTLECTPKTDHVFVDSTLPISIRSPRRNSHRPMGHHRLSSKEPNGSGRF